MAILTSNELKTGKVFIMDGDPWSVVKFEHIKMGRGGATNKVKAKNLKTGALVEKGYSTNVKFEEAEVNKKTAQYLYRDMEKGIFMNNESFEQYEVPLSLCEHQIQYLKEGDKVVIVIFEEKPISLELPKSVELKVTYAEPAVRGNTSGNVQKDVELETGLHLQVPSFIVEGDILRINTESGTYTERVAK